MTEEKEFLREHNEKNSTKATLTAADYTKNFGFEWTQIDAWNGMDLICRGHLFGRFQLSSRYFYNKDVVDVGCGNGRLGKLFFEDCKSYTGIEASNAIDNFPIPENNQNFRLIQGSATHIPLEENYADTVVCWGVLHHVDNPALAFEELIRILKPGGEILLFIYSDGYQSRENLTKFFNKIPSNQLYKRISESSDLIDKWGEIDDFYSKIITSNLSLSKKSSRAWQIFQWFDGVTPAYHWLLEKEIPMLCNKHDASFDFLGNGCYRIYLKKD